MKLHCFCFIEAIFKDHPTPLKVCVSDEIYFIKVDFNSLSLWDIIRRM